MSRLDMAWSLYPDRGYSSADEADGGARDEE
jgi:hypothetical protein